MCTYQMQLHTTFVDPRSMLQFDIAFLRSSIFIDIYIKLPANLTLLKKNVIYSITYITFYISYYETSNYTTWQIVK